MQESATAGASGLIHSYHRGRGPGPLEEAAGPDPPDPCVVTVRAGSAAAIPASLGWVIFLRGLCPIQHLGALGHGPSRHHLHLRGGYVVKL